MVCFYSKHTDDIYIRANNEGINSNIIHIEEIDYNCPMTTFSSCFSNYWTNYFDMSNFSPSNFNSSGFWYGDCSNYIMMKHNTSYSIPITVELTVMSYVRNGLLVGLYPDANRNGAYVEYQGYNPILNINGTTISDVTLNSGDVVKIRFHSTTIDVYINGEYVGSGTHSTSSPKHVELHTGSNRSVCIKDFKIKPNYI